MTISLQALLLALDSMGVTPRPMGLQQSPMGIVCVRAIGPNIAVRKRKQMARTERWPKITKKRWVLLDGSKRHASRIERRVRALRSLVPGGGASVALDGLFREAAEYIACLEMKVKVMKIMVEVLSSEDSND